MSEYNCPNCGAPINAWQCPYCGTVIHDFVNMDFEGHTPTWLRMKVGHSSVLVKAIPSQMTCEMKYAEDTYYADDRPCFKIAKPSATLTTEFEVISEVSEAMLRIHSKEE